MFAPEQVDIIEGSAPPLLVGELPPELVLSPELAPLQQQRQAIAHHRSGSHGAGLSAAKQRTSRPEKQKKPSPANIRTWLRIDQDGETSMIQADKWKVAHKLGVQGRDLRIMDPALATTYPSAILCRDRALVVNLEHIKVIITTTYVLVINPEDENVLPFITELKQKLAQPTLTAAASYPAALNEAASKAGAAAANRSTVKLESLAVLNMPFELKALEVCLDSIASHLNRLASDLEAAAYPALDALTSHVTSNNLERVRRIKGRLVRLTKRVETIREVLEHYLDDDQDMRDMNLTAAEAAEAAAAEAAAAKESSGHGHSIGSAGPTPRSRRSRGSSSSSSSSTSDDSSVVEEEIAQVEMLLEAYFMHLDNTFNRLQTLNEYIEDTEDLVNLKLDQHRNQLIGLDLMLTSVATALGMMTAVSGFFGMNLSWHGADQDGYFIPVAVSTVGGAATLLVGFFSFLWWRRLLTF